MPATDPRDGGDLLARVIKLREELATQEESAAKYKDLIAQAEKALQSATAKSSAQQRTLGALRTSAKALPLDAADRSEVGQQLAQCSTALERVSSIKPDTGSLFVRLFLGQVNVRVASTEDRRTLKAEYEKFRYRTNFGFIIFPLVWILDYVYLRNVWKHTHWINILTHVWLLYYYVSLALRTNILKVNASKIKPWWIIHHYVSAFMSIVVLTWPPESRSFDSNTPYFTAYFLYQGLVQFLQSRYQGERQYVRRAMGDKQDMDVAQTETLDEYHSGFWLLVSLLFAAYAAQLGLGGMLWYNLLTQLNLSQPWSSFREEMQCAVLGTCFLLLGFMNSLDTASTVLEKRAKEGSRARPSQREEEEVGGGAAAAAAGGGGRPAPQQQQGASAAAAAAAAPGRQGGGGSSSGGGRAPQLQPQPLASAGGEGSEAPAGKQLEQQQQQQQQEKESAASTPASGAAAPAPTNPPLAEEQLPEPLEAAAGKSGAAAQPNELRQRNLGGGALD